MRDEVRGTLLNIKVYSVNSFLRVSFMLRGIKVTFGEILRGLQEFYQDPLLVKTIK